MHFPDGAAGVEEFYLTCCNAARAKTTDNRVELAGKLFLHLNTIAGIRTFAAIGAGRNQWGL